MSVSAWSLLVPCLVVAGAQQLGQLLGLPGLLQAAAWRERTADRVRRLLVSCAVL